LSITAVRQPGWSSDSVTGITVAADVELAFSFTCPNAVVLMANRLLIYMTQLRTLIVFSSFISLVASRPQIRLQPPSPAFGGQPLAASGQRLLKTFSPQKVTVGRLLASFKVSLQGEEWTPAGNAAGVDNGRKPHFVDAVSVGLIAAVT
jgi:hypothetical protein